MLESFLTLAKLPEPDKFVEGLIGGWLTAAVQTGVGKSWGQIKEQFRGTDLERLLRNHDLRRVTYMAQCLATEGVCARWLDERRAVRQRARRGVTAPDWAAALTDPDMRIVAWWLRVMAEEARRVRRVEGDELEQLFGLEGRTLSAVVAHGSELMPQSPGAVSAELTEAWIAIMERFHEAHLAARPLSQLEHAANSAGWISARQFGLPATLRARLDREWFDIACAAFRELIKGDEFPKARRALELDLMSAAGERVSLLDAKLDAVAARHDVAWTDQSRRLESIEAELDGIAMQVEQLADGVRDVAARLQRSEEAMRRYFTGGLVTLEVYERGYWALQNRALDVAINGHKNSDRLKSVIRRQLVGRTAWLESFEQFLFDPLERSYVLHGHTGTGKSRLAIAAADLAAAAGFHVVYLRRPGRDVAERIRAWFEVGGEAFEAEERRVLLVWDNCDGRDEDAIRTVLELPQDIALLGERFDVRVLLTCWSNVGLHVKRVLIGAGVRVEELAPVVASADLAAFVTQVNAHAARFTTGELLERSEGSIELLLTMLSVIDERTTALPSPAHILHQRYQQFISDALDMLPQTDVQLDVGQLKCALRRAAVVDWRRDTHNAISDEQWSALERLGLGGPARDSFRLSIVRASILSTQRGLGRLWLDDPATQWPEELEPLLHSHLDEILVQTSVVLEEQDGYDAGRLGNAIFERFESRLERAIDALTSDEGLVERSREFATLLYSTATRAPRLAGRMATHIGRFGTEDSLISLLKAGVLAATASTQSTSDGIARLATEIAQLLTVHPSEEMATLQAAVLCHATFHESIPDQRRALVTEIQRLFHAFPVEHVATSLACALSAVHSEPSISARKSQASAIGSLLASFPSKAIALSHATTLREVAVLEPTPERRLVIAAEIRQLLGQFPSQEIAIALASTLLQAVVDEPSTEERRSRANEIGVLREAYPSMDIALREAIALAHSTSGEAAYTRNREQAAKIGLILSSYPSPKVALEQAIALRNAAASCPSATECRALAAEICELLDQFPSLGIAEEFALALGIASDDEPSLEERAAMAAEIGRLRQSYPSDDIALRQATLLLNATVGEPSVSRRLELAREIGALLLVHPVAEIAHRQALALYNATVGESSAEACFARAEEITALLAEFSTSDIALELAKVLFSGSQLPGSEDHSGERVVEELYLRFRTPELLLILDAIRDP